MLQVTGRVVNFFATEGGKNKDGEEYEGSDKVQLLGNMVLPNGDSKYDLMDLKVTNIDEWKPFKDKNIFIDVGVYAIAKNNIVFSVRKGAKPQIVA